MKETTSPKKNSSERKQDKPNLEDVLFLTGGDPAGIGPEIIRKSLKELGKTFKNLKILYFFNSSPEEKELLLLELKDWEIYFIREKSNEENLFLLKGIPATEKNRLFLYEVGYYKKTVPSVESGNLSFLALKVATDWIKKFGTKGLVTAPVSKEWIAKVYPGFSGHTRYLSRVFKKEVVMIMYSEFFSVIPITEHIPLRKVSGELKKILQKKEFLELLVRLYKSFSFEKGWALAGLNPHAGDNGILGNEEKEILIPFLQKLKKHKVKIEGPYPADSLFLPEKLQNYDLILTCYHDQGLIPFKALTGRDGINITFGLPFLRTSPDHGTAFDIAFKGIADPSSMRKAIEAHFRNLW